MNNDNAEIEQSEFNDNDNNITSSNLVILSEKDHLKNKKNLRSGITAKKYKKQIEWRRNKVRELLYKGYNQQEIISILHVSQSTVSRDIALLYKKQQGEINDYGKLLFENHFDVVNGSTELLKKAWQILDNPKTDNKTKLKAMSFIKECYDKRIELFQGLPYMVTINGKVREINKKEKYFKDNKIKLDYDKPMTAEEFDKSYREQVLKEIDREALF